MYSKNQLFNIAIEIAKESAKGGNLHPSAVLQLTFEKLKELAKKEGMLEE